MPGTPISVEHLQEIRCQGYSALMRFRMLILLLAFSSCSSHKLSVTNSYRTVADLASYHVDTPDPGLDKPRIGQHLLVDWSVAQSELAGKAAEVQLSVRYGNAQNHVIRHPVHTNSGSFTYGIEREEYFDKKGIVAYKAELWIGHKKVDKVQHHLWAKRITIGG